MVASSNKACLSASCTHNVFWNTPKGVSYFSHNLFFCAKVREVCANSTETNLSCRAHCQSSNNIIIIFWLWSYIFSLKPSTGTFQYTEFSFPYIKLKSLEFRIYILYIFITKWLFSSRGIVESAESLSSKHRLFRFVHLLPSSPLILISAVACSLAK